jgi:hypothetical protein
MPSQNIPCPQHQVFDRSGLQKILDYYWTAPTAWTPVRPTKGLHRGLIFADPRIEPDYLSITRDVVHL